METTWLIENLDWLIPTVGVPPIIWFATKRHYQARALKKEDINNESNQSDVVSKNLELYQRMLDDVEKRYETRIAKQNHIIALQDQEIKELRARVRALENNQE